MCKCPKRKEWGGRRWQRLRSRDRSGKIITALRTGGDAPIDRRRRYAVCDDGLTRLTSGNIVHWVMPVPANGYESDLSCRRRGGVQERHYEGEQQGYDPFVTHPRKNFVASSHFRPRSHY